MHRQAVENWFKREPDIKEYYLSGMIDAWYGRSDAVDTIRIKKA
jgi:hypothetical protein